MTKPLNKYNIIDDPFVSDCVSLFSGKSSGHMGSWEYETPLFPGDPAGGGKFWADLVKEPGNYYPVIADIENLKNALEKPDFLDCLRSIRTVVECGPGSMEAVRAKSLPFLKRAENLELYVAVDSSDYMADAASTSMADWLGIDHRKILTDFSSVPVYPEWPRSLSIIMWGISLGNFCGRAGQDSYPQLIAFLRNLARNFSRGDSIFISFDTETDPGKLSRAYSEDNISRSFLSIIHLLARYENVKGNFDPYLWSHKSEWIESTFQCAHYIYPEKDQHFWIEDHEFEISAGTMFLTNNSYKYRPPTILSAAEKAGYRDARIFRQGPVALLVATR